MEDNGIWVKVSLTDESKTPLMTFGMEGGQITHIPLGDALFVGDLLFRPKLNGEPITVYLQIECLQKHTLPSLEKYKEDDQ